MSDGGVEKLFVKNIVEVKVNQHDIVEVEWSPNLEEIKKEHIRIVHRLVSRVTKGRILPLCIQNPGNATLSTEAALLAASDRFQQGHLASATVAPDLAQLLQHTFYVRVGKPIRPVKAFKSKSEAIAWLRSNSHNN